MKPRIILAGGSGFLGQILAHWFCQLDWEVVVLTRRPEPRDNGVREVQWDGETLGPWVTELEGAAVVVNLAGRSVNCRYHARNRREMLESRLRPTRVLGEAIAQCKTPPRVWLNSSTATIYRHTFGPAWDEAGETGGCAEAKDVFSVHIATEWERVFNEANTPRTRKVALRSAMVLGRARNSVLPNLLRLGRLGLGGSLAGGRQFVSWIHEEDFCRAIEWIIGNGNFSGPVNLAAPNPVINAEFMAAIRKVCRVPFGVPAPRWLLEMGAFLMRTETELVIKSRHVIPGKLLASGFAFRHPHLLPAVKQLVAIRTSAMPIIELSTLIHAPRERAFDLARSIDAHRHTTSGTQERAVAGVTAGLIGMDDEVTWEARHFGVRQRLTVRVTAFDRPKHFQDIMISGAFKCMVHDHVFEDHPLGTIMRDRFKFASPLGILGRMMDRLCLISYMHRFLVRRNEALKRLAESSEGDAYVGRGDQTNKHRNKP